MHLFLVFYIKELNFSHSYFDEMKLDKYPFFLHI